MSIRALLAILALGTPICAQTQPGDVVISEIMWMGSTASSADEWVELYNTSAKQIDLNNWTLTRLGSEGEEVMLIIEQGKLAPGQTFLIANYRADHKNSRLVTEPQLVDAALSLPNSKLQLWLYAGHPDLGAQLVDTADDGRGAPLAGDGTLKRSMERIDFYADGTQKESWSTADIANGWDADATEMGTPGYIPNYLVEDQQPAASTVVNTKSWGLVKIHKR